MDDERWLFGFIAVFLALLVVVFVFAIKQDNRWQADCRAHGNHVVSHTDYSTVYVNGHIGTSSSTTEYCLNPAGGIVGMN